ncbi:MAG: Xaa-Pro peptidase family protein [bacterium]
MHDFSRIKKLSNTLASGEGFYISDFSDLFYFSGFSGTYARIIAGGETPLFITDSRYKGVVDKLNLTSAFKVIITKDFKAELPALISSFSKILLTSHTPLLEYIAFQKIGKVLALSDSVSTLRMIKDQQEIETLRRSVAITEAGISHVFGLLKEGVSEIALSSEFEAFIKQKGAQSTSFSSIVAFGENSAVPHHQPSSRKLKTGDLVLLDCGAKLDGYCSDLTRMAAFGIIKSSLNAFMVDYNIVSEAKKLACALYLPGTPLKDADLAAREFFKSYNIEGLFTHSLGHGLGLDVHEKPNSRLGETGVFKPGFVLSCEPGIYREGVYGIRIEDDYLVTENGPEKIGHMSDTLTIL